MPIKVDPKDNYIISTDTYTPNYCMTSSPPNGLRSPMLITMVKLSRDATVPGLIKSGENTRCFKKTVNRGTSNRKFLVTRAFPKTCNEITTQLLPLNVAILVDYADCTVELHDHV